MINWLSNWANQIIVAVIISTILEMILPNGKNKKYIKMTIGLYILFTILQPVLGKLKYDELDITNFNYKKYFNDTIETSSENFEDNNSNLIEQTYISNIENDIKIKIRNKGYELINCNINIFNNSKNTNVYGNIRSMEIEVLRIDKEETEKRDNNINVVEIEGIDIDTKKNKTTDKDEKISKREKEELIEYLSAEYSIDKKGIKVN